MSRLIIQGKAWGEFNEAKKRNGDIYISGYRTYGGTHTVRGVEQPTINENQQVLLNKLKINYLFHEESAEWAIYELLTDSDYKDGDIANDDLFVALDSFRNWVAEKESGENE